MNLKKGIKVASIVIATLFILFFVYSSEYSESMFKFFKIFYAVIVPITFIFLTYLFVRYKPYRNFSKIKDRLFFLYGFAVIDIILTAINLALYKTPEMEANLLHRLIMHSLGIKGFLMFSPLIVFSFLTFAGIAISFKDEAFDLWFLSMILIYVIVVINNLAGIIFYFV